MKKAYFNWSSGKDSCLALYRALQDDAYTISKLVTTVNTDFDRVSMHGLKTILLEKQAASIGFPLLQVGLQGNISMKAYEFKMNELLSELKSDGYQYGFFGDIYLEDLRAYREQKLVEFGVKAVFPLWKQDTKTLMSEFLKAGFKAITVCVNAKYLDSSFCGRLVDESFINDLPANVDIAGENGEFHTFVFDGPIFKTPVTFEIGEKVLRTYHPSGDDDDCFAKDTSWDNSFWYCDLLPI
ncbi:MJ0570-related uncharacterized domain-containing protein [Arenibacter nanhaiticus]|uniref:MJ0570-related uncharacterized domain-containing protein n=1 Tax=Arenibacter nanhaiticus TaxID=558155 RepID=A0A1M6B6R1_9FLAO|nr:diphthine--ammonia ligase [Arenibacter nanhaiticus]SHI44337.1 MJ0570-related uncharacterized domain-containing protein [Arenibacter nanhaiticus]